MSQLPIAASNPTLNLGNTDSLLSLRLQVRKDLVISQQSNGNETIFLIEDAVRGKFFQIGTLERAALPLFDGSQTVNEIIASNQQTSEPAIDLRGIANWLYQNGLVSIAGGDSTRRLQIQAAGLSNQRFLANFNLISLRIPVGNPSKILEFCHPVARYLFGRTAACIWLGVLALAILQLFRNWQDLGAANQNIFVHGEWVWMLVVWIGLKIIHEFGHGLACQHYGGKTHEAGISLILFAPLAYVDVTSSWRFANRWQRIVTAAAGMYVEIFIASIALVAWSLIDESHFLRPTLYKIVIAASLTTLLFNVNPLMKFDGYYILTDLLQIPNLYSKGTTWVKGRFQQLFLGWPMPKDICQISESKIVAAYGVMSFIWRSLVSIGLIIAASAMFQGAGVLLAMIAGIFWFGIPTFQFFRNLHKQYNTQPINTRRLLISLGSVASVVLLFFGGVPGPSTESAPAIVRYSLEQPLRATADAFIREIHVNDGDQVLSGDLLVTLKNDELRQTILALREQAFQANVKSKMLLQKGELALYQAEVEKESKLREQLDEKLRQQANLEIRAPFDGVVFARDLAARLGDFAKNGETILTLASPGSSEVVVTVDQADVAGLQSGSPKFIAVFAGQPLLKCSLKTIVPRASREPVHRALCADLGGPLPVRPRADKDEKESKHEKTMELVTPRVNVELEVPAEYSNALYAGQTGRVIFPSQRHSLGVYLFLAARDWVNEKIELSLGEGVP
jgi:putative peptide zinc metalloprotease protein